MDPDDIDYFQRRNVNDPTTTDATKLHNLNALKATGLTFAEVNSGDILVFREAGKPTVEFFTRRSRWKVRGNPKTHHGSVSEFTNWLGALRSGQSPADAALYAQRVAAAEALRPGITAIVKKVQEEMPNAPLAEVLAHAKVRWSSEHKAAQTGERRYKVVPNPEFRGGAA